MAKVGVLSWLLLGLSLIRGVVCVLLFLGTRTGTLAGLFERALPLGGVNEYIVGPLLRELPGSELGQHQRSPGPWLGCKMST